MTLLATRENFSSLLSTIKCTKCFKIIQKGDLRRKSNGEDPVGLHAGDYLRLSC